MAYKCIEINSCKDQYMAPTKKQNSIFKIELKKLSGKHTEEYDGLRDNYAHHIPLIIFYESIKKWIIGG